MNEFVTPAILYQMKGYQQHVVLRQMTRTEQFHNLWNDLYYPVESQLELLVLLKEIKRITDDK